MISDLAEQSGISPSKLLLPLSYAAILGGTLTLIGTSTNLLASDFARVLIDGRARIGMFEFSGLGVVVLVVGLVYLLTIGRRLTPARIPTGADLVEEIQRTTVLAIRRGGDLVRADLDAVTLQAGDLLLARMPTESIGYLNETGDLYVADEQAYDRLSEADVEAVAPLSPRTPVAVAIMAGVVVAAALDVVPIVIAAFAGVFGMVVSGCLSPADAYDAVSWNVIFLLAGVIPLGRAMDATGGAAVIAERLVAAEAVLPLVGVLLLTSP